jgi:hypothetical protein
MIYPNRAPSPELRPGMGYQPGSHALLGYQPGANALGYTAHIGYQPGANALGDFSPSLENAAIDAGIAPNDIDLLNNLGATDQDLTDLINGNVTVSQLYTKYGVTIPGSSTATAAQTPPSAAPASAVQIPPGSTILYTATFNPQKAFITASSVISSIAPLLPAHGMAMLSNAVQLSGIASTGSFSMTIMDSIGNQYVSDAQSILDALLNQFTKNGKIDSTLTVVTLGTTASGTSGGPGALATDALSWLENNALYIGLAVGGLVLLNNFTGGKRR